MGWKLTVALVPALLLLSTHDADAGATSAAIARCLREGVCVLALDATTTWVPAVPSISVPMRVDGNDVAARRLVRRSGAFFPVGFAFDLRVDSPSVFFPLFGIAIGFAPGSGFSTAMGRQERLELGDMQYVGLFLPGLGVHFHSKKWRVSANVRGVFSAVTASGNAWIDGRRIDVDGSGQIGWGVALDTETCSNVFGERRGVCWFAQGTQAYSSGIAHAVTSGVRLVF